MYEAFFNLTQKPFALLPDTDLLFDSLGHWEALRQLEHDLATRATFSIVTAEIGCGKTTLIQSFMRRLPDDVSAGVIINTNRSITSIAEWALMSFGRRPAGRGPEEIFEELMLQLISEYGNDRRCLLIIDEAQNLTVPALDDLRRLSEINSGDDFLLQTVLVGQPDLLETLRHPALCELAERISISYEIPPLSLLEVGPYVRHRLALSGCERPIFTEPAIAALHFFSDGIPRLINLLCDFALVYAFANDRLLVDTDLVRRVVADRKASGIAPFAHMESLDDLSAELPISVMSSDGAESAWVHHASRAPGPVESLDDSAEAAVPAMPSDEEAGGSRDAPDAPQSLDQEQMPEQHQSGAGADRQGSGIAAFAYMESLNDLSPEATVVALPPERTESSRSDPEPEASQPLVREQMPDLSESVAMMDNGAEKTATDSLGDNQVDAQTIAVASIAPDEGETRSIENHDLFSALLAAHREITSDFAQRERIARRTGTDNAIIPVTTRKMSLRRRFLPRGGNI